MLIRMGHIGEVQKECDIRSLMMKSVMRIAMTSIACLLLICNLTVHAAGEASIIEHFTTDDQVVLYIRGIDSEIEDASYQVGTTKCEITDIIPIKETSDGIKTLILWDNSLSVMNIYGDRVKSILEDIIANRVSGEQFAIAIIDSQTSYLSDYTDDYAELKSVIEEVSAESKEVYIIENLYKAIQDLNNMNTIGYKRIIIVSDGMDAMEIGYSRSELDALISQTPYPIYTIGFKSGDNQESLQALFGLSRATGVEYFYLNDINDNTTIVQAFRADYSIFQMKAEIPLKIRDGSSCNSQVVIKAGGNNLTLKSVVNMPFGVQGDPEESEIKETIAEIEDNTKLHLSNLTWIILGTGLFVIIIMIALIFIFVKKRRKISPIRNDYNQLDDRLINKRKRHGSDSVHPSTEIIINGKKEENSTVMLFGGNTNKIILTNLSDEKQMYQCGIVDKVIIGRNPSFCTMVIADGAVSEKHCEIFLRNGKFYIKDLNSSNGTFVKDNMISEMKKISEITEISTGTILKLGKHAYRVTFE